MGRIIYNIEHLAITFKGNVSFKKINFALTESTAINADGGIFLETKPQKVNQSITLEEISDQYLVVTVVDMDNVQTIHRFNNDDIQDLSWSMTEKKFRVISLDRARDLVIGSMYKAEPEEFGLNPMYEDASKVSIDSANALIARRREFILSALSKTEKEN